MLGLFAFLITSFAKQQHKLIKLFLASFIGSVATLLLQVILFLSQHVSFIAKYFGHISSQGTLVGSWVDFAYFVTFTFLLSLLVSEVLLPRGFFKYLSIFGMVLSIIILAFLNFKTSWVIVIVVSLLVFVYKSSVERSLARLLGHMEPSSDAMETAPQQGFPIISFIGLLIGLFFFLSSASLGASLARTAGVNFADVRPSLGTTTHVMRATLAHSPIFGAGPGRFGEVWNLYHPTAINQTIFWNSAFDSGFSLAETVATTNGLLTVLALLAAFVFAIIQGFKLFTSNYPDQFSRFIAVTSLIMLIAFLGLFLFASPNLVLVVMGFMYLGFLVGISSLVGRTPTLSLNYLRDPRMSFFAILILVVGAMVGFSAVYFAGNKFASVISYNRALIASDFTTAERRINRAITASPNDVYWRTRAALYSSQFANAAAAQNPDSGTLQGYFTQAEQSAQAAVAWDKGDASNWLALSQVYALVAAGNNADAYKNAKSAADEAMTRSPNNPAAFLNEAQIALTQKDVDAASKFIDSALALKADYLDAYVLRAQIKAAQGNSQGARDEIANYTKAAPFDSQGYVLLGNTELNLKDYQAALDAFARARQLAPNDPSVYLAYINALTLTGQKDQAITELQNFQKLFPNIQGVQDQINRLKSGTTTAPTSDATSTTDTSKTPTPTKK
nr:tetratricopeptide repeat protein [Candidatus Paceibacterota bacterium]